MGQPRQGQGHRGVAAGEAQFSNGSRDPGPPHPCLPTRVTKTHPGVTELIRARIDLPRRRSSWASSPGADPAAPRAARPVAADRHRGVLRRRHPGGVRMGFTHLSGFAGRRPVIPDRRVCSRPTSASPSRSVSRWTPSSSGPCWSQPSPTTSARPSGGRRPSWPPPDGSSRGPGGHRAPDLHPTP